MKVVHAELHNSVVFPVTEVLGIMTLNSTKVIGLEMDWSPELGGLVLTAPKMNAKKVQGFIPAANVKCLEFALDNVTSIKKK